MDCPRCQCPIVDGQPAMAVHMGATRSPDGYMADLFETFHRPCAAAHLIGLANAKAAALRTSGGMPPEFFAERTAP